LSKGPERPERCEDLTDLKDLKDLKKECAIVEAGQRMELLTRRYWNG
jgi:hypothetical protein